jgi:hypothetical protein
LLRVLRGKQKITSLVILNEELALKHVLYDTVFPNLDLVKQGKVRDIYDLGDSLLMVANFAQSHPGQRPNTNAHVQVLVPTDKKYCGEPFDKYGRKYFSSDLSTIPGRFDWPKHESPQGRTVTC